MHNNVSVEGIIFSKYGVRIARDKVRGKPVNGKIALVVVRDISSMFD